MDPKLFLILLLYFSLPTIGIIDVSSGSSLMKFVPADDILTNISKGQPVIYDHVNVIGDLALSKLNLIKDKDGKYLIKSQISIIGSNFSGKVLFGNAKFLNNVEFIDNEFNNDVKFNDSEFERRISFGEIVWGSVFNKQASFHNSIFKDDANFESVQFKRLRDADPFFEDLFLNATFNNRANFNNVTFYGNAYFTGASFFKDASFQYAKFQKEAIFGDFMGMPGFMRNPVFYEYIPMEQDQLEKIFGGCTFYRAANFYRAEFNGDAYFKSTKFRGISSFKYATFRGDAVFGDRFSTYDNSTKSILRNDNFSSEEALADTIYQSHEFLDPNSADIIFLERSEAERSKLNFEQMRVRENQLGINSTLNRIAIGNETLEDLFGATCFQENANFIRTKFEKNLYFINTTFKKNVDFFGAFFNGNIKFNNAKFYENAYFNNIRANEDANFASAKFQQDADFSNIEFARNAYFDDASFQGEFNLTNAKIERLYLRWKSIKNHLTCNDAIYLYLVNNFKNQGLFDDADDCWYDRMKIYQNNPFWLFKIICYLSWPTCGYGVKLHYTLICSALIVFLFPLIFYGKNSLEKFSRKETSNESSLNDILNHRKEGNDISRKVQLVKKNILYYDPFLFSLITFTSGRLALIFPETEYRLNRNEKWASVEMFLGWIFISMILYMMARMVIRI